MPLDTYANLQTAVLSALARPDDPLVAPALPDLIQLFESEARRRLRVGGGEHGYLVNTVAGQSTVPLPADCGAIRIAEIMAPNFTDVQTLHYISPSTPLVNSTGRPAYYTLYASSARAGDGGFMRLGPVPDQVYTISLSYLRDLPPLTDFHPVNWLLASSPDCYFFGVLVEAEMYVGHDERVTMWLQRRDLAFASIEKADIKARWSGPMQIRVDGITTGGWRSGGSAGGGSAPAPVPPVPVPSGAVYVVSPFSGSTVTIPDDYRAALIDTGPLAHLTIRLPEVPDGDAVEVAFAAPVTTLVLQTKEGSAIADAPVNAYGPGAALVMRYVASSGGFQYWK